MKRNMSLTVLLGATLLGLMACEDKGPVEQAGEEVDEAVDTIKRGEESTENKVDDAVDEAREGAQDAADEVRNP
jgi:predicted small lipoprotein YifL